MAFPKIIFKVIEETNCPFYKKNDKFTLSGKALLLSHQDDKRFISTVIIEIPLGKPECRILYGDITSILIKYQSVENVPDYVMNCSGCTGSIRLQHICASKKQIQKQPEKNEKNRKDSDAVAKLLSSFSIFRTLDIHNIKAILAYLKLREFPPGHVIINRGDPSRNLYIIASGKVEVLGHNDIHIAYLGSGEVFGEMSILSGAPAGAAVKTIETIKVLYIEGRDFRKVLNKFPSLQMYFARLLSRRLARSNIEREKEMKSGMIGKLVEMPPPELFQTLNTNRKTGVLTLTLSNGPARFSFREGELIRAGYDGKEGKEAFFDVLEENEGRFRFVPGIPEKDEKIPEIGDFMWLLMEGLRRIDEKEEQGE